MNDQIHIEPTPNLWQVLFATYFLPFGTVDRKSCGIALGKLIVAVILLITLTNVLFPIFENLNESFRVYVNSTFFFGGCYSFFILLIKRLRDTGWSVWWSLIFLIPTIGTIFAFVVMFRNSASHENEG